MAIARLVDGTADEAERRLLDTHLATCDVCCAVVAAMAPSQPEPPGPLPAVGEQWAGRYVIVAPVGQGASGAVFHAVDRDLGRQVALKIARGGVDKRGRERWRREAQAGAALDHPNVAPIFEIGEHDGRPYIAMGWLAGQDVRAWLRRQPGPRPRQVVEVFRRAAEGLAAAHQAGLLHRDFKPDNVMLDGNGVPRIIDFGLAASRGAAGPVSGRFSTSDEALTMDGAVVGTPLYLAPELLAGGEHTQASDQYAFCLSLYEALAGRLPHTGKSVEELAAARSQPPPPLRGVPGAVTQVVLRGLASDPADRFASMGELARALDSALAPRPRWPWLAAGGLAALIVTLGLVLRPAPRPLVTPSVRHALGTRLTIAAAFARLHHPAAIAAWRTVDHEVDLLARGLERASSEHADQACLEVRQQELILLGETLDAVDVPALRRLPDVLALPGDPAACLGARPAVSAALPLRREVFAAVLRGLGRGEPGRQLAELEALHERVAGDPTLEGPLAYATGVLHMRHGELAKADEDYERALTASEAAGAPTFRLRVYTASLRLVGQGYADPHWRARLERARALLAQQGGRPWLASDLEAAAGRALAGNGDVPAGLAAQLEAYRAARVAWGDDSVVTARTLIEVAVNHLQLGQAAQAEQALITGLVVLRRELGPLHPEIFDARAVLAQAIAARDPQAGDVMVNQALDEALAARLLQEGATLRLMGQALSLTRSPAAVHRLAWRALDLAAGMPLAAPDQRSDLVAHCGQIGLASMDLPLVASALAELERISWPGREQRTRVKDLRRALQATR